MLVVVVPAPALLVLVLVVVLSRVSHATPATSTSAATTDRAMLMIRRFRAEASAVCRASSSLVRWSSFWRAFVRSHSVVHVTNGLW